MASKKCPKCGEDNPAEAVMCWACYTPLSGGAAAAATSAAASAVAGNKGPVGMPASEDEGKPKKSIDPRMIGVGVFLLVAGGIGFMLRGGGGGDDGGAPSGGNGGDPTPVPQGQNPPPSTTSVAPSVPPSTGAAAPAPLPIPFTAVTSPNPTYATGTVGILVSQANLTPLQAAGFAKFAKNQFSRQGRWQRMQICVFGDQTTADTFKKYQSGRKGAPLASSDYDALSSKGVWGGTPAFLESIGEKDLVYYPSKNPYSWWSRR